MNEDVRIKIGKLDLKPGDYLAMICPESWTIRQVVEFSEYINAAKVAPEGVKLLVFPFGTKLEILRGFTSGMGLTYGRGELFGTEKKS